MNYLSRRTFSTPVDRREVARSWRERGYSCGSFSDPPGRAWEDFVHETNELVTVLEGRLKLTIAGEGLVAEPGDEVFIPRNVVHSVVNIAPRTTLWLYGYD